MYAVITGASSGFGVEFARQFAKRGYNLCIVARREKSLSDLKAELEEAYHIIVDTLTADLAVEAEMNKLYNFTKDKDVDVLVNNAGMLVIGMPDEPDILKKEMRLLDINVKAVHYLTRLFLSDMIAKNKGKILNVSSLSGWIPVPWLSAYAAGKAYVLHFSEALNFELRQMKSNVRVSVTTPGFLNTEISVSTGKTLKNQGRPVSKFIEKVVEQFLGGKEVIILGQDRLLRFMSVRISPRRLAKAIGYKISRKNLQE